MAKEESFQDPPPLLGATRLKFHKKLTKTKEKIKTKLYFHTEQALRSCIRDAIKVYTSKVGGSSHYAVVDICSFYDMCWCCGDVLYGKISSTLLLKKLGTYSRKNRLYQAFQELGRVNRTMFLLEYLSSLSLREIITDTTNKVELYNALSNWACFASPIIVSSNDPDEMEKAIKYNLLVCNCVILQNIIDLTETIHTLQTSNIKITKEDISRLSLYLTSHIKRFGDYVFDLETKPKNIEKIKNLSLFS